MYPPRPNYAVLLIVLAIALVVCVAMYVQLEHGLAANDASKVSLDLSAQVQVAQRLSDAEAQRVLVLANANRQNKEGEASLTESRGRAAQAYAVATKTVEESRTIRDDRDAKKVGYGGIAARELLDALGGLGGVAILLFVCMTIPFAMGAMTMLRFTRR